MKLFAEKGPCPPLAVFLLGLTATWACSEPASGQSTREVTVATADGQTIQGDLIRINSDSVQIGDESSVLRPNDSLSEIRFPHLEKQSLPTLVELSGGSKIHVSNVVWDGDRVELTPARQPTIELPVDQLKSIRYRPGNPSTDVVWIGWTEEARRGDRLAVRRDGRTLDSLDGTVVGIQRDTIQFEMGSNTIDAPIAKLEGVLFSTTKAEPGAAGIRVNDTSGSQYIAQSIELAAASKELQITLTDSVRHSIPVDQLISIQYAGGILRLSDAEIAASRLVTDATGRPGSVLQESMQVWFSPKAIKSNEDDSAGVISMQSPGEISFRIPPGYRQFIAAVRRLGDVNAFLPTSVEVLIDGQKQWTGTIENRESLGLELPISGARLLTLKVFESLSDQTGDVTPVSGTLGGSIEWFSGRLLK